MSRGLGFVERGIIGALQAEPDNAFTVAELCDRIYATPTQKKHRVAVIRAVRKVTSKRDDFGYLGRPGVGVVVYNRTSPASSAMAQAKLDGQPLLRRIWWSNDDGHLWEYDGRQHWVRSTSFYHKPTSDELEEMLRTGQRVPTRAE